MSGQHPMEGGWGQQSYTGQAGPPPRRLAQRVRNHQQAGGPLQRQPATLQQQTPAPQQRSPAAQQQPPPPQQQPPAPQQQPPAPQQQQATPQQAPVAAQQQRRRPLLPRPPMPPRYRPGFYVYNHGAFQYQFMPHIYQPSPRSYRPAPPQYQSVRPQQQPAHLQQHPAHSQKKSTHPQQKSAHPKKLPVQCQQKPAAHLQQPAHAQQHPEHLQQQSGYLTQDQAHPTHSQQQHIQPLHQPGHSQQQQPVHSQQRYVQLPQQTGHLQQQLPHPPQLPEVPEQQHVQQFENLQQQPAHPHQQLAHPPQQNAFLQQQPVHTPQWPTQEQVHPAHPQQQSVLLQQQPTAPSSLLHLPIAPTAPLAPAADAPAASGVSEQGWQEPTASTSNVQGNVDPMCNLEERMEEIFLAEPSSPSWTLYKYYVEMIPNEENINVRKALLQEHSNFLGWYLFEGTVLYTVRQLEPLPMILYSVAPNGQEIKIIIKKFSFSAPDPQLNNNAGGSTGDKREDYTGNKSKDFTGDMGSKHSARPSIPLWVVVTPERDRRATARFIEIMQSMGDDTIPNPNIVTTTEKSCDQYFYFCKRLIDRMNPAFLLCVVNQYECYRGKGIDLKVYLNKIKPTIILRRNNMNGKSAMSVAIKVAFLVSQTLGCALPERHIPISSIMVIGYDVCQSMESQRRRVGALVSSLDSNMAHYDYTLIDNRFGNALDITIAFHVGTAAERYRDRSGCLPKHIIFYRDNVADIQLPYIMNREIYEIRRTLSDIYGSDEYNLAYILTSRDESPRYFVDPLSSTVYRRYGSVMTNAYDFYIIDDNSLEQALPEESVSVTFYHVIYDDTEWYLENMKFLTHVMTKLHFRSRSNRNIPLVLRFAQKLAYLAANIPMTDESYAMIHLT